VDGIDCSVVKSYDIRGTYPRQLDERFAYLLGRALLRVLPARRVAVGRDCRLSSPALAAALAAGLRDEGAQVGSLGLCPTELVYYVAGARKGFDLGVMVTASHNPPEYNGFKVVKVGGEPVTGATGLREACRLMEEMTLEAPDRVEPLQADVAASDDYAAFALDMVGVSEAGGLRVVVDPGNGVGGLLWDLVTERLGLEPVRMNFEPDGSFPAHHPDPSRLQNLEPMIERVRREGADLGFAYDGDADRVVVVLGDGHVVDGSEMTACIAMRLLEQEPTAPFGVAQTTSRKVLDFFAARGIEPVWTPVGHSKIKNVLRARPDMVFAGEDAGHYYYRDFFCCDSSLLTTLHVLHLASDSSLRKLVGSFARPWHRPAKEPSFAFSDQGTAMDVCRRAALAALEWHGEPTEITCEKDAALLRHCGRQDVEECDGVRVDYADWWFCVRPSGTEPIARLALEARTEAMLAERTEELSALFREQT
jgi:phosphomannomutase